MQLYRKNGCTRDSVSGGVDQRKHMQQQQQGTGAGAGSEWTSNFITGLAAPSVTVGQIKWRTYARNKCTCKWGAAVSQLNLESSTIRDGHP